MIVSLLKKLINKKNSFKIVNEFICAGCSVAEGSNGLLALYEDGSDDKPGQTLTEFKYKEINKTPGRLLKVKGLNDKFGFINCLGKEVWGCEFDSAIELSSCKMLICKNGKYGMIDTIGRYILAPIFKQIKVYKGVVFADAGSIKEETHNWHAYTLDGDECSERGGGFTIPPLRPNEIINLNLQANLTDEEVQEEYNCLTTAHSGSFSFMYSVNKVAEEQKKFELKYAKQNMEREDFEALRKEQEQKLLGLLNELFKNNSNELNNEDSQDEIL